MGSVESKGGLRVHQIFPNGPAHTAGLEVFFDYIITANEENVSDNSQESFNRFLDIVTSSENDRLILGVYNALTDTTRNVIIYPAKWNGEGLIGARVIYDEFNALFQGNRVLGVLPDSPASRAGLVAPSDYIIASTSELLIDQSSLCDAISNSEDTLELLVYSSTTESIRQVTIELELQDLTIGCDLGNGFLHQIPRAKMPWSNPYTNVTPDKDYNDKPLVEDGLYPSFIPHINKSNTPSEQKQILDNDDYI